MCLLGLALACLLQTILAERKLTRDCNRLHSANDFSAAINKLVRAHADCATRLEPVKLLVLS